MAEGSNNMEGKEAVREGRPSVLLVEDDIASLKLLRNAVRLHGSFADPDCTDSVSGATELLRKAKKDGKPYDFVICDLGLTDDERGGFKVAETAMVEGGPEFMLYTGRAGTMASEYTPERLREMGIDKLLGKPASAETLEKSLDWAKEAISKKTQPVL